MKKAVPTGASKEWIASQEASLVAWFNHVIDGGALDASTTAPNAASSAAPATPGTAGAFRQLVQTRRLERERHSMRQIFRSAPMVAMRRRIDAAVAPGGSLTVRRDRHMYADVGLQAQYMKALLDYNPRWLRVALEVVIGERVEGVATTRGAMKRFIHKHMLHSPELTATYASTIQGLHGEEYIAHIHRHALRSFVTVAALLDFAKASAEQTASAQRAAAAASAGTQGRRRVETEW